MKNFILGLFTIVIIDPYKEIRGKENSVIAYYYGPEEYMEIDPPREEITQLRPGYARFQDEENFEDYEELDTDTELD